MSVSSDQYVHEVIVVLQFSIHFGLCRFHAGATPSSIESRFAADIMCGLIPGRSVTRTIDRVLCDISRAGLVGVLLRQLRCGRRLGVVVAQSVLVERNLRADEPRSSNATQSVNRPERQ